MLGLGTSCLYSRVKNTSGVAKVFGFIPPHGKTLAAGEAIHVFGDIRQAMFRFERSEGERNIRALEAAIQRGDISITHTASVIVTDDANPGAVPQQVRLHNGTLGVTPACWEGSVSNVYLGDEVGGVS